MKSLSTRLEQRNYCLGTYPDQAINQLEFKQGHEINENCKINFLIRFQKRNIS